MLPDHDDYIESVFPDLARLGYKITSPRDVTYNCIGWAAHSLLWWEPDMGFQYFWPIVAPRSYTPEAFIIAYQTAGFSVCESSGWEEGYEKIALYVDSKTNHVLHASRQISTDTWTSKLGTNYDISHTLHSLDGEAYSKPELFMKRPVLSS